MSTEGPVRYRRVPALPSTGAVDIDWGCDLIHLIPALEYTEHWPTSSCECRPKRMPLTRDEAGNPVRSWMHRVFGS